MAKLSSDITPATTQAPNQVMQPNMQQNMTSAQSTNGGSGGPDINNILSGVDEMGKTFDREAHAIGDDLVGENDNPYTMNALQNTGLTPSDQKQILAQLVATQQSGAQQLTQLKPDQKSFLQNIR